MAPITFSVALTTLSQLIAQTVELTQKLEGALPEDLSPQQMMSFQNIDRIAQRLQDCQRLCETLSIAAPQMPLPLNIYEGLKLREIRDSITSYPSHPPKANETDIEWF